MADVDLAKILSVPELYRFIKTEVPLGRVLAPVSAWLLLAAVMVWAGKIIWTGIGAPVITLARGGVGGMPQGQLGASVPALALFAGLFWLTRRYVRGLMRLHQRTLDLVQAAEDHKQVELRALTRIQETMNDTLDKVIDRIEVLERRPTAHHN